MALDHGRPGACERPIRVTITHRFAMALGRVGGVRASRTPHRRWTDRGIRASRTPLSVFPYRDGLGSDCHPPVWSRPAPDRSSAPAQGAFAAYPCPFGPAVFHGPLVPPQPTRPAGPCATDPKADEEVRPGPDPRALPIRGSLRDHGYILALTGRALPSPLASKEVRRRFPCQRIY